MSEQKSKISATLIFSGDGNIQSVNLNAETDGDIAKLSNILDRIMRPQKDEILIRLKWLTAIIEKAALEYRLARLSK